MNITHIVIHELEKESGKIGASLTLFDTTVDSADKRVVKLITELNNRYKHRTETYGVFDSKNPTVFHSAFEKYYKSRTEKDFIDFTHRAAEDLKTRVDTNAPAKGGYLIFAHYEQNRKYVAAFLVRNTVGLSFKKDIKHKQFNLDDVQHIDFENLAMACRISIDAFRKKEIRYLSFINKKGDDMSQYFTRWISSTDTETNEEDTKLLYNLLYKLDPPNDKETKKPIDRHDFLDRVYSAIRNSPGRVVNVRNISESFYGDADYLNNQIDVLGMSINGEFKAHPKTLRKFIHIRAKADNVELAFPHTAYKTIVRFDEKDKSQIIIKSEKLVQEVKAMINNEE